MLNAGALSGVYMLFAIASDIIFGNDLGLDKISSSPLMLNIFGLFFLIIAPIVFRLVGLKPIKVDLF